MKRALKLLTFGLVAIISILLVTTGCLGDNATESHVNTDPFTVSFAPETSEYIVTFSGDTAGHKTGEPSEFMLRLDNNTSETLQGDYIVQLVDENVIVTELARDTFTVSSGVETEITVRVTFDEWLDGPYGLSLYLPAQGSQTVTTIWIGEKDTSEAGPWPSLGSHPWLWPDSQVFTGD